MTTTPIRELRAAVAGVLAPLGIEIHDVLPDHVNPPAIAVGLPTIGGGAIAGLNQFTLEVTLVGERADFTEAQYRLDDLQWQTWELLRDAQPTVTTVAGAQPLPLEVAGQNYPAVVFSVTAQLPC